MHAYQRYGVNKRCNVSGRCCWYDVLMCYSVMLHGSRVEGSSEGLGPDLQNSLRTSLGKTYDKVRLRKIFG